MSIPSHFIQELLARADVVEIVGRHVQLKKGGANFMGLCPFHSEKSPSFTVSPTKQFYHCFGCSASGDAIKFLTDHLGMTFHEAVQDLAQQYGLQVPEDDLSPQARARAAYQRQQQATLTDVLEKACTAYKKQLKAAPHAIGYLQKRGLTGAIAQQFGLGYAPDNWRTLASVFPDYDNALLVESGLVISNTDKGDEKRYDRFRDRMMFPIRNIKGECIGFGGRVLGDGMPKYLNSPETPVFSKGRELYGLFEARSALREHGFALVTEGYMDVVALAQMGFPNAVATLGTACTAEHVHKLFRFTDAAVFSFDGDAAGRRAARKALDAALPYATDVRSIKFLFLPAEHDPDSYIRAFGQAGFAQKIDEATPLSRFLIEVVAEDADLNTAEGRAHISAKAAPLWGLLPDGALKRQILGELANQVQLSTLELKDLWGTPTTNHANHLNLATHNPAPRLVAGSNFQAEIAPSSAAQIMYKTDDRDGQMPQEPGQRRKFQNYPKGGWRANKDIGHYYGATPLPLARPPLLSRADIAARLLLSNMAAFDTLTTEDHVMLCDLPAPHGALFTWLESQLHDSGPLPWAALRIGLAGLPFQALALNLMQELDPPITEQDPHSTEFKKELRGTLNRLLIDRIKLQQNQAIEDAKVDASALQRWRELAARRSALEALQTEFD